MEAGTPPGREERPAGTSAATRSSEPQRIPQHTASTRPAHGQHTAKHTVVEVAALEQVVKGPAMQGIRAGERPIHVEQQRGVEGGCRHLATRRSFFELTAEAVTCSRAPFSSYSFWVSCCHRGLERAA